MRSRTAGALATVVLLGLGLFTLGCEPKVIPIAAILPLTGADNVYGEPVRRGLELAYEQMQSSGEFTVQILLTITDSESDPEIAKARLSEAYEQGALLALGAVTSAEAKAMIAVAERYDKILISPTASAPELSGLSQNFYRIWPSDGAAAGRMAQFVSQDLEVDEVVIIAEEKHEYAMGIQGAFQSAYQGYGGKVVEVLGFPPNTSDFSGFIDRVMTIGPKAVYVTAYGEAIGMIIKGLREGRYTGKILTTSAFASARFIVPVGDAAAGVMLTQSVFEPDSDHTHVKTFVDGFRAKYDEEPDIFAAHGYDLMRVVASALDGRKALSSEVPKGLREVKDFPGVTGSIRFDEKGDVLKYPRIYIIGKDLLLNDYNERVRQQQQEIRKRREELREKLDEIERKAKQMSKN